MSCKNDVSFTKKDLINRIYIYNVCFLCLYSYKNNVNTYSIFNLIQAKDTLKLGNAFFVEIIYTQNSMILHIHSNTCDREIEREREEIM